MVDVLVLYYSVSGNVEAMAKAVAEGAGSVDDVSCKLKRVDSANVDDFIACDAVAFGSPNYFGYMAGLMKDFFDRAWPLRDKVSAKLAAAFTCGGSSSNAALLSVEKIFGFFKLKKACDGVIGGVGAQGVLSEEALADCRKVGEALAKAAVERKAKEPTD